MQFFVTTAELSSGGERSLTKLKRLEELFDRVYLIVESDTTVKRTARPHQYDVLHICSVVML